MCVYVCSGVLTRGPFLIFNNKKYVKNTFLLFADNVSVNDNIDRTQEAAAPDEVWQDNPSNMPTFPFAETNQLLTDLPANAEPYDYFRLLVTDEFLDNIISESNSFAEKLFLSKEWTEKSRISEWKDLTRDEFLKFIGLVYHMGNIKLNKLQDYWKTSRLFNLKCISDYMSRDRFLLILRCLHFAPNPEKMNLSLLIVYTKFVQL